MSADLENVLSHGYELMDKALHHLDEELGKVRAGKASPAMLGSIMVEYYGTATPLTQVASVTSSDSRTLTIQPWEKNMLGPIEKSIFEANMGIHSDEQRRNHHDHCTTTHHRKKTTLGQTNQVFG